MIFFLIQISKQNEEAYADHDDSYKKEKRWWIDLIRKYESEIELFKSRAHHQSPWKQQAQASTNLTHDSEKVGHTTSNLHWNKEHCYDIWWNFISIKGLESTKTQYGKRI